MTKISKVKISAVSYTNTLPFRMGIESSPQLQNYADVTYDIPAVCASKLIKGEVDIGLIPIAVLSELKNYQIVSDYCIGADGRVDTVKLYGNVPVEDMETIILDYQSRTSVMLIQVLARNFWKINPDFITGKKGFEYNSIKDRQGAVMIGDRTFDINGQYPFQYDLAEVWKQFTGLPFVFAAWVANKPVDAKFQSVFNKALQNGIGNISEIADKYKSIVPNGVNLHDYFTNCISYSLTEDKKKAMNLFLSLMKAH